MHRVSAEASTIIAFFTQRFISRGSWEADGRTVLLSRGTLGSDTAGPASPAQSTVTTVGVLITSDELLLLGPDGVSRSSDHTLLEQLGLQSWREAGLSWREAGMPTPASTSTAAEKNVGGLGGGFKRFVWEPIERLREPRGER